MDKILFVDDEADVEILAKQKFRKEIVAGFFEILFAHNAHDALSILEKESRIAVVVTDLNMPGIDGLTFLNKLSTLYPTIKKIVVSAYGDIKTIRTAMNTGVFDFITKPVDFKELGDTIMTSLALYHATPSSLYTYQRALNSSFPNGVELTCNPQETNLLWDAFPLDSSQLILMGINIVSSTLPSDIAIGIVHGIFKMVLMEGGLSLNEIEEKIYKIFPSLKANVLIGQYFQSSHEFSYQGSGEFKVLHQGAGKVVSLPSSQTTLLALEDVIIFQHPLSLYGLSFRLRAK